MGGDGSPGPSGADVAESMRPAAAPSPGGSANLASPGGEVSHAGPARTSGGRGGLLVALGAVAAIGFGAPVLLDRIETLERRLAQSSQEIEAVRREHRTERAAEIGPLRSELGAREQRLGESLIAARAEVDARIQELEAALERIEAESVARGDRMRATIDASSRAVDGLREGLARAKSRAAELEGLKQVISYHGDMLVELEERLRSATVAVGADAPSGASGGAAMKPDLVGSNGGPTAAWGQHLEDLGSPDPGLRLDAVFALGQTKDVAVVPHVVPMLSDEDVFVRMVSAQVLGGLRAKVATPALIEALDDERSAVREAAVVALRSITNKKFDFDPVGKVQERARALEAWRSWWKRSGPEFLAS